MSLTFLIIITLLGLWLTWGLVLGFCMFFDPIETGIIGRFKSFGLGTIYALYLPIESLIGVFKKKDD